MHSNGRKKSTHWQKFRGLSFIIFNFYLVSVIFFAGCATKPQTQTEFKAGGSQQVDPRSVDQKLRVDKNWSLLREGMSYDQVDELIGPLGPPDAGFTNLLATFNNVEAKTDYFILQFIDMKLKVWTKR